MPVQSYNDFSLVLNPLQIESCEIALYLFEGSENFVLVNKIMQEIPLCLQKRITKMLFCMDFFFLKMIFSLFSLCKLYSRQDAEIL